MRFSALAACVLVLLGCSPATVDGSSEDAMKSSVDAMKKSLSPAESDRLGKALMVIAFASSGGNLLEVAQNPDSFAENARRSLDGKTAEQIIAEADRITAERLAREREQALAEVQELQREKAEAEATRVKLAAFEIAKSRFYKKKGTFREEPVIELVVKNGTEHAVSRAYFKGTLSTPGRSVPWLVEDFNYQIAGGVEPGETAQWNLAPNMFSEWGKVQDRPDMVFTVEVTRLDGADGEALFDSTWSDRKEERLQSLNAKFH